MKREKYILCISPAELIQEVYMFGGIDIYDFLNESSINYILNESNIKYFEQTIEVLIGDYYSNGKSFNTDLFKVIIKTLDKITRKENKLSINRCVEDNAYIEFKVNDIRLINQLPHIKYTIIIIALIYRFIKRMWIKIDEDYKGCLFEKYTLVLISDIEKIFGDKSEEIIKEIKYIFPNMKLILK